MAMGQRFEKHEKHQTTSKNIQYKYIFHKKQDRILKTFR